MKLINNKKAFTLVETLGVITILAIVLGIVSAAFIYVNDNLKKTYYMGVEENLFAAGGEYFAYNKGNQPKVFGNVSKVLVSELVNSEYISEVVGRGNDTCDLESSYVGAYKDSYDKTNYFVCLICDDYVSSTCNTEVSYNLQTKLTIKDTSEVYKENTWAPDYVTLTFKTLNDIQNVYAKKNDTLVSSCELVENKDYKTCKLEIDETGSYMVYGEGENGNKTKEETIMIKIDSTPPGFKVYDQDNILITNNEINYKKEDATLTVSGTVSDIIDNESGIKRIRYSFEKEGNSETYKELTSSTLSFDFNKEVDLGKYVLIIEVIDNVGNVNKREITYNIYSELGKPDSSYCKSNLVYSGVSQLLTNSPGVGFSFIDNYGTDAQVYDVIVRLNENYSWSDGTRNDVIINCEIAKSPESEIGTCKDLTYNGNSQYLMNLDGNNVKYVNNSAEGLNAGTYIVQAQPADSNYAFSDGETTKTITCTINKKKLTVTPNTSQTKVYGSSDPTFTYTYTGNITGQTPGFTGKLGRASGEDVGSYKITQGNLTLQDNGTFKTMNYNLAFTEGKLFTIEKANAICPTLTAYSENYDGNSHSIGVSGGSGGTIQYSIDNSTWTTTKPTRKDAGETTVYVRVVGDTNHNTVSCGNKKIVINRSKTATVGSCNNLTYNGNSQTLANGASKATYQSGTNAATNAGSYEVIVNANSNYAFSDGSISTKLTCEIKKANGYVNLSATSGSISYATSSKTFTVTSSHGGTLSVSDNHSTATTSRSGNTITIGNLESINAGTIITVTVKSAATTNYKEASATYKLTINRSQTAFIGTCKTLTYNGNSQYLLNSDGNNVTYKNSEGLNAGEYIVEATSNSNYAFTDGTTTKTITCTIGKANGYLNLSATTGKITYGTASKNFTVTSSHGGALSVTDNNTTATSILNGNTITLSNLGTITGGTTITATVKSAATTNYKEATAAYSLTINAVNATCPTLTAYSGNYDGYGHSIGVSGGSGGTIQYSIDNSTWTTTKPTRIESGTTTVYVRVVGDTNHNTVTCGSETISISKVDAICPTLTAYSGNYDGYSHSIGVSGGSGGTIQYSIDNSTWTTTKPTRIESGTTTVYVRVVGDTNHNTVSCGSKKITINGTKICANFYRNGAAKIGNSTMDLELCCQPTSGSSSCQVTTPTITPATNFEALGWSSRSSSDTNITNEQNVSITLTSNKTFYAITRSNNISSYSIEFNLNGADSYSIQGNVYTETNTFICRTQYAYNGGAIPTTCTFTLPTITRSGGKVYGWDLDENNQGTPTYSQNQTITVSSDMILNAITSKNISISFDGNGGVSTIPTQTAEVFNAEDGAWITIPAYDNANLCRSKASNYKGYQNIGLISDTTHTTADYCQGKTYFFDKSETLFGLWKRTYGTGTINTNSKCLYIREETSTSSDDKACVDKGEKIYLTGKPNSNWYAVKFGSVTGYSWASYISFPSSGYAKNSCEYTGYTCDGKDYELNVSPSKIVLNLYKNETSYQLTIDSQCGSITTATSSNSKVSVTTSGLVTVPSNAVAYGETLTSTLTFTSAGSCTDTVSVTVKNINETPPTVKISISGTKYSDGYKSGAVATVTCESSEGISSFSAKDNTGDTGSLSTNTSTKKVRKITLSSASSSRKITASCTSTNGLSDSASKTVKIYVNSASSKCGSGTSTYSGSCSCYNSNTSSEYGERCNANIYAHGSCSNWCKNYQATDGSSYTYKSGTCTKTTSYPTCWHT